jgi:hypothetical protein
MKSKQQSKRRRLRLAEFDGARSGPQLFERLRLASSVIVNLHAALWGGRHSVGEAGCAAALSGGAGLGLAVWGLREITAAL